MSATVWKVDYIVSHRIQYQAPLFRALAAHPEIDLCVYVGGTFDVKATGDPVADAGWRWDIPIDSGYVSEVLPNVSPRPAASRPGGVINPAIVDRIRRRRPDCVILHGYVHTTNHIALAACKALGIPVLLRGENHTGTKRPLARRTARRVALKALFRIIAGALVIGTRNREFYRSFGMPEEKLFLAPYAVDNDRFRRDSSEAEADKWRAELDLPRDARVVLFTARLSAEKGCHLLIDAFAQLAAPDTYLVIIGDGAERAKLEHQARIRLGESRVRFTGFLNQSRLPSAYRLASVFVLPSTEEMWGLVVNEAMSVGLPIVCTDAVGCAPDLVGPDNGWIVPAGDVDALARALGEALGPETDLAAMGAASARRIARWGVAEAVEGFVEAVKTVSARRSRRAT